MEKKESKKEKRNFWTDGLSMDETKFSTIVVMAAIGFGYSLIAHYLHGEISDNLLTLVSTLIYSILGMNGAKIVADAVVRTKGGKSEKDTYNDSDEEGQG